MEIEREEFVQLCVKAWHHGIDYWGAMLSYDLYLEGFAHDDIDEIAADTPEEYFSRYYRLYPNLVTADIQQYRELRGGEA